jgi:mRNA interferase RelE/StbE
MGDGYRLQVAPAARRQLLGLAPQFQLRIRQTIRTLATDPRPRGAKLLADRPSERVWRVRVGDYRVLYEIRDKELVVLVVGIGHRREVYRSR